jgi:Beta-propeller repeat
MGDTKSGGNHTFMNRRILTSLSLLVITIVQAPVGIATTPARRSVHTTPSPVPGKLPVAFEPNVGQTDAAVRFVARGGGMTTFFTDSEAVMVLTGSRSAKQPRAAAREAQQAVVRMKLVPAKPRRPAGLEKLPGYSNYFLGNDPAKWHTRVPHYGRVEYQDVYPGVDLVWHGEQQRLEYDFVVAPGADASRIQVEYDGVESISVDAAGDLRLRTALGELRQERPRVFQESEGRRIAVSARYALASGNRVGFKLGGYDPKLELRIDPVVLAYSTFVGNFFTNRGWGIAVDVKGAAYITGLVESTRYPTQSPYQSTPSGPGDAFVTKLTPAGDALVYSTYLGGSAYDQGYGIAVDAQGSAYVMGTTQSSNFPTQSPYQASLQGTSNAFVTKLTPAGDALVYSTYLGTGSTADLGVGGIAVDASGAAYVTSDTQSSTFPTQSAFQATLRGSSNAFVTKLSPAGNELVYSTYLGGAGTDQGGAIAVDGVGSAYITGSTGSYNFLTTKTAYQTALKGAGNAFVTKLSPAGDALVYSTYVGGSGGDGAVGIALDSNLSAYIVGSTNSTDFPTRSPVQATYQGGNLDAFVTKLSPAGDALVYSTYLGGAHDDSGYGIAVDASGSAYVTGSTGSSNFPTQAAFQPAIWGNSNAFVTELSPSGNSLVYSTFVGGSKADGGYAIAVDEAGSAYITGGTSSTDFPTTASAYQPSFYTVGDHTTTDTDVFVTKIPNLTPVNADTPCNVNGDVAVDAADVQAVINQGLGSTAPVNDFNPDGAVSVVDVQMVINASLGMGCSTAQ